MSIQVSKKLINELIENRLNGDKHFNTLLDNSLNIYKQYIPNVSKNDILNNVKSNIVKMLSRSNIKYNNNPEFIVIMGAAGSGKSTIYENNIKQYKIYINHDLDEWRDLTLYHKYIYKELKKENKLYDLSKNYENNTHDEVSIIGDILRDYAIDQDISLLYQTASSSDWLLSEINRFINSGFDYKINIMTTPYEISKYFIYSRFFDEVNDQGFGRLVDKDYHVSFYKNIYSFLQLIENSGIDNSKIIFHSNYRNLLNDKDNQLINQFKDLVNHPLKKKDIDNIVGLIRYSGEENIPNIINEIDENIVDDFIKYLNQFKRYLDKYKQNNKEIKNNIELTI